MLRPAPIQLLYGPHEAVGHLARPERTAVLVLSDGYQTWSNPSFAQWQQVVFMDMPCNGRERILRAVGEAMGWNAKMLERWADHYWIQVWRGNMFPFRKEHARAIDAWMRQCLEDPNIDTISIHCVYGKNRSRAVWAVWSNLSCQGNEDVYRGLAQVKSRTSSPLSGV